jgi:hypothetical protein
MSAYTSSSLAFSDHNNMRNGKGLLKNLSTRISKQHLVEHKMFGSKRKNIRIGKKFRQSGKGIKTKPTSSDRMPKSGGISPSLEEFDKMMNSIVGKKSKKAMFSRKQFG